MVQNELIQAVAKKAGLSAKDAKAAVQSVIEQIGAALKKGESVRTTLGTFKVFKRSARMGRNPQTGEAIKIKAKRLVRFSASKTLKQKL